MKNQKFKRRHVVLMVIGAVVLLNGLLLFLFRFELWRRFPEMRGALRLVLLADPGLKRKSKAEIRALFGTPDVMEGRYGCFAQKLDQKTGDLVFTFDDSNQITRIHFLWGEWKPISESRMDLVTWRNGSDHERWAMNADLVKRWPKGEFIRELGSVDDVLRHFPGYTFIDYWQYASDGSTGIGGSLDFEFDPQGRVAVIRTGFID